MPDRSAARTRLALTFVAALILYALVVLISGEPINLATILLGVVLAALLVWWGEARRRIRGDAGRRDGSG